MRHRWTALISVLAVAAAAIAMLWRVGAGSSGRTAGERRLGGARAAEAGIAEAGRQPRAPSAVPGDLALAAAPGAAMAAGAEQPDARRTGGQGRGLGPDEVAGRRMPPPDWEALTARLSPERRAVWTAFRSAFPDTDLTEVQQRHQALLARRAQYGGELSPEEREEHARWVAAVEDLARALVELRAESLGLSPGGVTSDGRGYWLEGFENSAPRYTYTQNANAAISTAVTFVRMNPAFDPAVGASVTGEGLYVNVNDHGTIYDENPEFQLPNNGGARVVYKEIYDEGSRTHATHVTGTIGAWGYNPSLMGMTPRIWIRSHIQQYTSDITEYGMATPGQRHTTVNPRTGEVEGKSVVGNTSLGNPDTNEKRGIYTSISASYDSTLRDYPYYTHFYAAGNNGTDNEETAYYTLLTDTQVAKNILTIGSVTDTARDAAGNIASGGVLALVSSRGPTYDGRIKPDLVANGVGLLSPNSPTGFGSMSGTSMASPNAAGSAALLVDYIRRRLSGHYFRSSTIRALLVNSADDRGLPGPDYSHGWGLINVYRAAAIVKRHAEQPASHVVVEELLNAGQTWSAVYRYDGAGPIRVTLAWLDPPGEPQTQETATRAPRLVNDLNLRLIGPGGAVHHPYVMPFVTGDGTYPPFAHELRNAPAVTGVNTTDNVEQVFIAAPAAGDYTLEVSHAGALSGGSQRFSLAISGLARPAPLEMTIVSIAPEIGDGADGFALTVNGDGFPLGANVLLRRAGSPDAAAYEHVVLGSRITCRVDTSALEKGYWDVVVRAPDGVEEILPNAFLLPVGGARETLYANDFESGAGGLTLGAGWEVAVPNKAAFGGPATAAQGEYALVTWPGGNYPGNVNTSAELPAVSTAGLTDVRVEIQRWLGVRRQGVSFDYGYVEYSINGGAWQVAQSHTNLIETRWAARTYTLPASVNDRASLRVRFRLQTDANHHSFGWNIDELQVTAYRALLHPPVFVSEPVTIAAVGQPYEYAAAANDGDTVGAGLVFSATGLPPGVTLTNRGDGTALIAGAPAAAGDWPVRVTVTDGAYNTHQEFTLAVRKGAAVVTLSGLEQTYAAAPRAVVVETSPPNLPVTVTYDGANTPPTAAGIYAVRAVVSSPDYEGEAHDTLAVLPAPLTLAADPKTKFVGAPDPALTWRIATGELFGADAVVGAPARDPGEASGVYPIRRGTLDAGPNYALQFQESALRILTAEGFVDANGNEVDDEWEARYWPDGNAPATVVKRGVEMPLRDVFLANLDPFDDASFFAITELTDDRRFTFTTSTNRLYTVEWRPDLRDPAGWQPLPGWVDVPGTGAPMQAVAPDGASGFIRVRVRLPPPQP